MSRSSPSTILFTIVSKYNKHTEIIAIHIIHYKHVNKWSLSMHKSHLIASKISDLTCIMESNVTLTCQSQ